MVKNVTAITTEEILKDSKNFYGMQVGFDISTDVYVILYENGDIKIQVDEKDIIDKLYEKSSVEQKRKELIKAVEDAKIALDDFNEYYGNKIDYSCSNCKYLDDEGLCGGECSE